jgi:hypothetical protein
MHGVTSRVRQNHFGHLHPPNGGHASSEARPIRRSGYDNLEPASLIERTVPQALRRRTDIACLGLPGAEQKLPLHRATWCTGREDSFAYET